MLFSSDFSQQILTQALAFQSKFAVDQIVPRMRRVGRNGVIIKSYSHLEIKQISRCKHYPGGFVLEMGEQRRRHLFASESADKLIAEARSLAGENVGVFIPVATDLDVQKETLRQESPLRRILCLSETCLIERDPASCVAICARAFKMVVCLDHELKDPQKFTIEYENGDKRTYTAAERYTAAGALVIASMLDFLTYTVCAPFSETTRGDTFDIILELVSARGRSFYKLFHNPSMTIIKGAFAVM
ncbi:CBN-RME-8 protein [Aphelenchoides avenae]|nr:CBN-RME-8 protein [Aphelenchus avenae]